MKIIKNLVLFVCISLLTACSTLHKADDPGAQSSADPFQGFNRKVYAFNNFADKALLKPAANTYKKIIPGPLQNNVGNFFSNLSEPLSAINNLLQGKFDRALQSTYRFTVNSTMGILGLFDVAEYYEIEEVPEDFGQTLAAWGMRPGPYIMLPLLGPSNFRDGLGLITENTVYQPIFEITHSVSSRIALTSIDVIDIRSRLIGSDEILDFQLDPYAFLKLAYEKNRLNALYDGQPPQIKEEDFEF